MEEERRTEVRNQTVATGTGSVNRQTVKSEEKIGGSTLAQRIVYYIGTTIVVLLAIRFVLLLLGASQSSGFVNFIYDLTNIFAAPFNGIFTEPTYGSSTFDSATLVAMFLFALLTFAVGKLLTINKKEAV